MAFNRKLFLTLGFVVLSFLSGMAQNTNSSPYSRFGLGEFLPPSLAHQFGMGGVTMPLIYPTALNPDNPATYSGLIKPTFDVGFSGRALTINENGSSSETGSAYMRNITFGVPISKRWGAGFGVAPVSTVGYDITITETDSVAGAIDYRYNGTGGMNKAFMGASFAIVDNDSASLAIGINANYMFGTINQFRRSIFDASEGFLNTRVQHSLLISDFQFDLGFHYHGYINRKKGIRFSTGAKFGFANEMKADKDLTVVSYERGAFDTEFVKDTIEATGRESGQLYIPSNSSYGIAVDFNSRLTVAAQYDFQNWSDYEERFSDTTNPGLQAASSVRFGLQYRPKPNLSPDSRMWNRGSYRLGVRYGSNYLQFEDINITTRAVTAGFGFSLARQSSKINFGIEIGDRGTVTNNLIREQFTNFYIGISLSPIEKWFRKRKYD